MIYRRSVVVRQGTSFASHGADSSVSMLQSPSLVNRTALVRVAAQLAVVVGLVVLAALNISVKRWTEMEDGVLWVGNGSDVVASVVADDSPASRAGIKPGDVLLRIDAEARAAARRRGRVAARRRGRITPRVRRRRGRATPSCSTCPGRRDSVRHALAVSGARRRRPVLAVRRHRRAAAPAGEPGDAAFLLAVASRSSAC